MKKIPKNRLNFTAALCLAAAALPPTIASAQEAFLGEVRCFGFNFVPRGWAALDGTLLSISQNNALFALLGTQFGGDGRTTFALPDMRGRSLINVGQGPGMGLNTQVGETGGSETVALATSQLPPHSHLVAPLGSTNDANAVSPEGKVPAAKSRTTLYTDVGHTVAMAATTTSSVGSGQPVPTRSPYLALTCAMATQGIFPSRN